MLNIGEIVFSYAVDGWWHCNSKGVTQYTYTWNAMLALGYREEDLRRSVRNPGLHIKALTKAEARTRDFIAAANVQTTEQANRKGEVA